MRSLISIDDISVGWWNSLYARCVDIMAKPGDYLDACRGKVLATLFYEPSTRTNFSFQAAMLRLGGSVFGFADPGATSAAKGETLADTVRIAGSYADAIVLRSPHEGAALAASLYSEIPLVNAGDGGHHHPTQTLADLTTIARLRGGIGDMTVGFCGDLKYGRTVHSLMLALSKFRGVTFVLISPNELRAPGYILSRLDEMGVGYRESGALGGALPELDILYMTRIQRERFGDAGEYEKLKGSYVLTRNLLRAARDDMLVMHPLPRLDEISPEVDADPRAVYFEQARYGMFARMALLLEMTGHPRARPAAPKSEWLTDGPGSRTCDNTRCVTRFESYLPKLHNEENGRLRCAYCDEWIT